MPNLVINVFAKIEEAGQNINKFSLYNLKQFQQVLNHGKNKIATRTLKLYTAEFFLLMNDRLWLCRKVHKD